VAWLEFRRGKRTKPDIQQFEFALEDNIFQLHDEFVSGVYRHGAYTPFTVNDPKPRRIHKASVRDRLVHHAVFRILYPIFDRSFIFDSYSCRIRKGTHSAVRRMRLFAMKMSENNSRDFLVLKCDVRRFFDSVDHDILLSLIRRKISDVNALKLITIILESFHKTPGVGIPLGNITSQLFANIYLNELDRFVKHELRVRFYLRYCDDFFLVGYSSEILLTFKDRISEFLSRNLQTKLHPDKISIRSYRQGIDMLGYVIRPYHTRLRTKTKKRMLKMVTIENIPSYLGMLKHCNGYTLEQYIRNLVSF